MRKVAQFQQASPDFDGPGMIDDFRLWGSTKWRTRGLTDSDHTSQP